MKITREYLRRVIKEELERAVNEDISDASPYTFLKTIKLGAQSLGVPTQATFPEGYYKLDAKSDPGNVNVLKPNNDSAGPPMKMKVFQELFNQGVIVRDHIPRQPSGEVVTV